MKTRFLGSLALLAGLTAGITAHAAWTPNEGRDLIGTRAPEWRGIRWIQGGPLSLADLRGKVVLLRFWLTDCPYCARTAPALRDLFERYRGRGLVVVGIHHPKSRGAREPSKVEEAAGELGMAFPIGQDNDWRTIRAYGVGTHFQRFTSVSFLIDASGTIRFVHDGGEFHGGGGADHRECNEAFEALESEIGKLLSS